MTDFDVHFIGQSCLVKRDDALGVLGKGFV